MGTAERQGRLWGRRAHDWAEQQEHTVDPLYDAVLRETAVGPHTRLLDVGCGAGGFCRRARALGATVSGLDASPALVEIARGRTPDGDFRTGEMESLPYEDGTFDLATGFNSFQYAAEPVRALAEARRVVRPGGAISIAVWGAPERAQTAAVLAALAPLLPPPPPGAPGPFALSSERALEDLARRAGLAPVRYGEVECPFRYADETTALRGLLSSGPSVAAIDNAGEDVVRDATRAAIAPFRRADGSIEMRNVFVYLIATA